MRKQVFRAFNIFAHPCSFVHVWVCVHPCIPLNGRVHVHHLSVDDGRVLAAVRGCRVWVVGLSRHGLYGNELQGARGGVIWIWRTEREFTHKETTNTSNHYIVSQRGAKVSRSLFVSLSASPSLSSPCLSMADTVGLCQTSVVRVSKWSGWTETIDHKDSVGFKRLCQCISVIDERNWLCTFIPYPTSDKLDSILVSLNSADELFKSAH